MGWLNFNCDCSAKVWRVCRREMHKRRQVVFTITMQGKNSKKVNRKATKTLLQIFCVSTEDEYIHVTGRKQTVKGVSHATKMKEKTRRHVIKVMYLRGQATATNRSAVTTHKLLAEV